MSRRTFDMAVYGIASAASFSVALASIICLIRGIDTVAANTAYLGFGLVCGLVLAGAFRDAYRKGGDDA